MSKALKILLIVGILLTIVGTGIVLLAVKDNINNSKGDRLIVPHDITEEFTSIDINIGTADIEIKKADDSKCKVECVEKEKEYNTVEVIDGTLTIKYIDARKWYEKIALFQWYKTSVIVYLPDSEYNNLKIVSSTGNIEVSKDLTFNDIDIDLSTGDISIYAKVNNLIKLVASTGDIKIENTSAKNVIVSTSTGDLTINNLEVSEDFNRDCGTGKTRMTSVRCKNLNLTATTGNVYLKDVICTGKMTIKTSTGDVNIDHSDANTIKINTSTGDVKGNILTNKTFYAYTNTGKPDVPQTSGNECTIETSTGDIIITITN